MARRREGSGLREEVADEVGDALRKGLAAVKDAGARVDLLDHLVGFAARSLVVMR
jgi:hypothetical protein